MTEKRDLLIEIGTEELPPKALRRLSDAFAEAMQAGLQAASPPRKDRSCTGAACAER